MKKNLLKSKKGTAISALIAAVAGFVFLDKSITGNAIFGGAYTGSILSLIGLLLIACAAILAGYAIKK
jgi:hypothetical protein